MNRPALTLAVTIAALVTGCVPTLHPIYTKKDVIFDKALVGLWRNLNSENSKETWRFAKSDGESYRLVYTDSDGKEGAFHVHLARIQDTMFLDLQPEKPKLPANDFYKSHIILAHSFLLVERIEPDLRMRAMDPRWLEKYLKQNADGIAHEKLEGGIVITASTHELQQFVLKHVKTKDAFGEAFKMKRERKTS